MDLIFSRYRQTIQQIEFLKSNHRRILWSKNNVFVNRWRSVTGWYVCSQPLFKHQQRRIHTCIKYCTHQVRMYGKWLIYINFESQLCSFVLKASQFYKRDFALTCHCVIIIVVDVASPSVHTPVAKIAPAPIAPVISIAPRLAVKQEDDHHQSGLGGIGIHTTKEWIVPPRPKVCLVSLVVRYVLF